MSSFEKIGSTLVGDVDILTLYRSHVSGCNIVIVDHESPFVRAEFNIATVHENDYGLAHALEHLIFQGSKNYPYDSFLKEISQKAYGSVNGRTSDDFTVFKLSTVGSEGFLKVLPAYLDSIFNPLLVESKFKTEVHHIDGEGKHGGVVYSEMLTEHGSTRINKVHELIYGKDSPFARNIGGFAEDIRENCTLDRIKEYHDKYYKMENMFITIIGSVPHDKVLESVRAFERSNNVVKSGYLNFYKNMVVKPFKQTVKRYSSAMKLSSVNIRWLGPDLWDIDRIAMHYLMDDLIRRLWSDRFVYKSICLKIFPEILECKTMVVGFYFSDVDPEYLQPQKEHVFRQDLLHMIKYYNVDLSEIRKNLQDDIDSTHGGIDDEMFDKLFKNVQLYQNYAPAGQDNVELIAKHLNVLKELKNFGADYWTNVIKKYFTDDYILVFRVPGQKEEDNGLQERILEPQQLEKYARELEEAVAANEARKAPEEFYEQFNFNEIKHFSTAPVQRSVTFKKFKKHKAPVIVHKTASNCIILKLLFDGRDIPTTIRPLIPLFLALIKSSESFRANNEYIGFKTSNEHNIIEFEMKLAEHGKVAPFSLNYKSSGCKLTIEKTLTKLIQQAVISPNHCEEYLDYWIYRDTDIIDEHTNPMSVLQWHKHFLENMKDDEFADDLIQQLTELKESIQKAQFNLHAIGNPEIIKKLTFYSWPSLKGDTVFKSEPLEKYSFSESRGKAHCSVSNRFTSSHLKQIIQAPFENKSEQFAYSELLNIYFCQHNGPVHRAVRGNGFAYHAAMSTKESLGIAFKIDRASNLIGAHQEAKRVVVDTVKSGTLNNCWFQNAKKTAVENVIKQEHESNNTSDKCFRDYIHGCKTDETLNQIYIKTINEATPEAVLEAVGWYYLDLFDDSKNVKAMIVPPHTKAAIGQAFPNVEYKYFC